MPRPDNLHWGKVHWWYFERFQNESKILVWTEGCPPCAQKHALSADFSAAASVLPAVTPAEMAYLNFWARFSTRKKGGLCPKVSPDGMRWGRGTRPVQALESPPLSKQREQDVGQGKLLIDHYLPCSYFLVSFDVVFMFSCILHSGNEHEHVWLILFTALLAH